MPTYFVTSAEKKQGADEVLEFIEEANKRFGKFIV
jgi:hypothetical protein